MRVIFGDFHSTTQVAECRQNHRAGDIGLPTQNTRYLQWKHTQRKMEEVREIIKLLKQVHKYN